MRPRLAAEDLTGRTGSAAARVTVSVLCVRVEMSSPQFSFPPESYSAVYTGDDGATSANVSTGEWRVTSLSAAVCVRATQGRGAAAHRRTGAFNSFC